jgi:D-alanyl-D-alanine carboxypeptidase (penicillin-binding protein 5/6)
VSPEQHLLIWSFVLILTQAVQYTPSIQSDFKYMHSRISVLLIPVVIFLIPVMTLADIETRPIPAPPIIGAKSYFVVDANTGYELASLAPDKRLAPASLTKLMTAYVIFKSLAEHRVALDDQVKISEKAWRTSGSRMFILVGTRVTLQDLLLGMIVQSGNDASVALAEHVAVTEFLFTEMMNQYAATLGMHSSHFENATGLPDEQHYSTARDLAMIARAIINEFPEYYKWYSIKKFEYNNISQNNRNSLLWRDSTVDGMKTGHTDDAGYCLIASAKRDGMRIVSIVLGTASKKTRTDGSQSLINYGFRFFETKLLYKAGEAITNARIWKSSHEFTPLGLPEDLYITVPRGSYNTVESVLNIPAVLVGPITEGQPLAELKMRLNGTDLVSQPLRALNENPSGSLWQRTRDSIKLWFN